MITYTVLWETMERRGVTEEMLMANGISEWEMERLKNDGNLSTETIEKLCRILRCDVGDVMESVR